MRNPSEESNDRVDVGIVVAMPLEAAAIVARMRDCVTVRAAVGRVSLGRLGEATVAIMASGIGGEAAVRGTRLIAAGHRPGRIVAAGVCGGLDPALCRNAILVADRVRLCASAVDRPSEPVMEGDCLPIDPLPETWNPLPNDRVRRGMLVTSGTVIATASAKKSLHDSTHACGVDMESWWIVVEARRLGLPVHVVRAVCDTATETVPGDVASLATAGSAARIAGTAVRLLWRRPSAAIDMVELRERAHSAADAVALHLETMLERWRPEAADDRSSGG